MSKPGGFKRTVTWKHKATESTKKIKQCRTSAGAGEAKLQVHVDPLLMSLSAIRSSRYKELDECFCVMGVTMIDLYSHASDLFVAGMAAGGTNVAVFSFHRYHPCLKVS